MSEYVPLEIQAAIIKKVVPAKSLIRFRSVSKQWKSLIESPEFITRHTFNHRADTHHLLVRYYVDSEFKYVSIVDDDDDSCFPKHKCSLDLSPAVKKLLYEEYLLHCSHGLVCLYRYLACGNGERILIMWNPSIRKSVSIMLPCQLTVVGVGVCPKTSDPKIVKLTHTFSSIDCWEAEVFTLSTRAWRSISMNMPLPRSIGYSGRSQVVVDGVIYWSTYDDSSNEPCFDLIVSFDLTSEQFGKVDLPDGLTHGNLSIEKLNDSLEVLNVNEWEATCDVWLMREKGFVKLFSLTPYDGYELYDIIGFRRNGQPIRERGHPSGPRDGSFVTKLKAYEPSANHSSDLGIYLPHSDRLVRVEITSYTDSHWCLITLILSIKYDDDDHVLLHICIF